MTHEYFNRNWDVMPFSDVVQRLQEAKLSDVAPAHLIDHVDAINLAAPWQKLPSGIENPVLRQTVRDLLVNQQFHRQIFVKGPRRLSALETAEAFRAQPFVLTTLAAGIPLKVTGSVGEVNLPEQIYRPIIDALAQDSYAPKTLADIAARAKLHELPLDQLISAMLILVGTDHVCPAQPATAQARERCSALNEHLCEHARGSSNIRVLASPVTGTGISVDRFHPLFLLAQRRGHHSPADQAAFAWKVLSAQGQRLVKGSSVLATAEQNLAELTERAAQLANGRLPLLKALGVVDGGAPDDAPARRGGGSRSASQRGRR